MSGASGRLALKGKAASQGFAEGPLVRLDRPPARPRAPGGSAEEERAFRTARAAAAKQIAALAASVAGDAADILEFQLALLDDDSLVAPVFAAIATGTSADDAWNAALAEQIADYRAAPREYLQARAADLVDLRDRVLGALNGEAGALAAIPSGAVIAAADLPPSRFLEIDWSAGWRPRPRAGQPDQPCCDAGPSARRADDRAARHAA